MDEERSQEAPGTQGQASLDQAGSDQVGFDLGAPAVSAPATGAYRVLARKYRPSTFEDLIGQEAMVRTLRNAFMLDRIHQAYLLTGVRGVGKTTTARILARAFNYQLEATDQHAAINRPSVDMPVLGLHCGSIVESRHIDVIEMDAASNTGIDDVREIIESARYKPVLARYKVFIIDEVHMLSKAAFNGLLKTLEEPPEHVKFVFATTEIDKVPVTVRSRCQRFDLRRIESGAMVTHLSSICGRENVAISAPALSLIARAAEGSVRDALSLLDQAIAHGPSSADGEISEDCVRDMLGVADRARVIDLFEAVMKGDMPGALGLLKDQYDQGADPNLILIDVASFVHFVTLLKLSPDMSIDKAITEEELRRGKTFAASLSMQSLTRAWQIITKGLPEIRESPRPLAAADMVLIRIAFAADLPSPEDALRRLANQPSGGGDPAPSRAPSGAGGGSSALARAPQVTQSQTAPAQSYAPQAAARAQTVPSAAPRVQLARFEDLVALSQVNRDIQLRMALERDMRLVRFEQGSIEFSLVPGASPQIAAHLMRRLQEWTGERWMVAISTAEGAPTINERQQTRQRERAVGVRADPLVQSVLERFPGAEIVSVRSTGGDAPEPAYIAPASQGGSDEVAYVDEIDDDDF
jgi:DNA polymerase-3 subunit gamma/tau